MRVQQTILYYATAYHIHCERVSLTREGVIINAGMLMMTVVGFCRLFILLLILIWFWFFSFPLLPDKIDVKNEYVCLGKQVRVKNQNGDIH